MLTACVSEDPQLAALNKKDLIDVLLEKRSEFIVDGRKNAANFDPPPGPWGADEGQDVKVLSQFDHEMWDHSELSRIMHPQAGAPDGPNALIRDQQLEAGYAADAMADAMDRMGEDAGERESGAYMSAYVSDDEGWSDLTWEITAEGGSGLADAAAGASATDEDEEEDMALLDMYWNGGDEPFRSDDGHSAREAGEEQDGGRGSSGVAEGRLDEVKASRGSRGRQGALRQEARADEDLGARCGLNDTHALCGHVHPCRVVSRGPFCGALRACACW